MRTLFIGSEKHSLTEVDSTNTYLKKIIATQSVAEGLIVKTEYQTLGRGQIGNRWESEKGQNLLFSLFLKPKSLLAHRQFYLNMSVCLAVCDALNSIVNGFQVKWPNDILFQNKKVAGILIENSIVGDKLDEAIVGVGVNINQEIFENNRHAISLKNITANHTSIDYVLDIFCKNFEARYLKLQLPFPKGLYNDYYSVLYGMNQRVTVEEKGALKYIEIQGVDPSGALLVMDEGKKRKLKFKEVKFILD